MMARTSPAQDVGSFDMGDDALRDAAKIACDSIQRHAQRWQALGTPEATIRKILRSIAKRYCIELPSRADLQQSLNRLCDPSWWRRALRKRFRAVEQVAIEQGRVHCHAGKYVSDRAMARALRDKRRISELLASLVAVNQTTGEMIAMDALAAQSLANPANRRSALMARIKGIEQHAKAKGHEAVFLTITCPSRMHARRFTGAANDRYDSTGPRRAHAYLHRVWRLAMRKLDHDGVSLCGLRVVEPHHDGCPHWHVLAFVPAEQCARLIDIVRDYALQDSPDEPGAAEHRFKVERIDPAKGSAVGYVAKYVSKSIDGEGVDVDNETGARGSDTAPRIVAWARLWGVRQFQFFGVPAITPTRELYRLERVDTASQGLIAAHLATKANDYGAWLAACDSYSLAFRVDYSDRPSSRYSDEIAQRITGLTAQAVDLAQPASLTTREDEWRIEPIKLANVPAVPPWTRFNNCAPIDFKGFFDDEFNDGIAEGRIEKGRTQKSVPRRPPQPNAGRADWRSSRTEHSALGDSHKNMPGHGRKPEEVVA